MKVPIEIQGAAKNSELSTIPPPRDISAKNRIRVEHRKNRGLTYVITSHHRREIIGIP